MRIGTFNLQNLRLCIRNGAPHLHGATDDDISAEHASPGRDIADRRQSARVIARARADILALQEVFDTAALDHFHDHFLRAAGAPDYPHRICLPGNDGRGLNVAALSRIAPLRVLSHAHLTGRDLGLDDLPPRLREQRLFRRDCLQLEFDRVTLFVCHFKAPYPDADAAHLVREAEARAVRKLVEARFADPARARWIVLGDLNEPTQERGTSALTPLTGGFAIDLITRLPPGAGWTYALPQSHLRASPDRILISPRLAREYPRTRPRILRAGMRRPRVGAEPGPHASDHALLHADFPGL